MQVNINNAISIYTRREYDKLEKHPVNNMNQLSWKQAILMNKSIILLLTNSTRSKDFERGLNSFLVIIFIHCNHPRFN